jgi:hypothetical protein
VGQLISWRKSARVDRSCQYLLVLTQTYSDRATAKGTPHFVVLSGQSDGAAKAREHEEVQGS